MFFTENLAIKYRDEMAFFFNLLQFLKNNKSRNLIKKYHKS